MRADAVLILSIALHGAAVFGQDAGGAAAGDLDLLLEEAFYQEAALHDADRAMDLYRRVQESPAASPRQAAIARLRLGICLRLQGRIEEAEREFQAIIDRFPEEKEAARLAARHLGAGAPGRLARFFPGDTLIYTELVNPGEQAGFLSDLLRGTPLENPVDYYLKTAERREPPASRLPRLRDRELSRMRAVLNLGFIKEFQKIEGLALGFTGLGPGQNAFLGVFLPGASDVSRGLVKALLSLAGERVVDAVDGLPIFALGEPDPESNAARDPVYIAIDAKEEFVLFGAPLAGLREALVRARGAGSPASLAEAADFRRARGARAGSILFTYFDLSRVLDLVRRGAREDDRRSLDLIEAVLGLRELEAASVSLSRSGDSFALAFRSRVRDARGAWEALRTPVLDPAFLELLPPEPLGFAAFSAPGAERRLAALLEIARQRDPERFARVPAILRALTPRGLDPVPPASPPEGGAPAPQQAEMLARLVSRLENAALVLPPPSGLPIQLAPYVLVTLRGGEDARSDLEAALGLAFQAIFQNRASAEFRDAESRRTPRGEAPLRFVELAPGWRAGYLRSGDHFAIALRIEVLEALFPPAAAGAGASIRGFASERLPVAASKVLYLRPREIFSAYPDLAPAGREGLGPILPRIPQLIIHSLESTQGVSLEMLIPNGAPLLRQELMGLPVQEGAK